RLSVCSSVAHLFLPSFFYSPRTPLDHPSFPTRRSSDLTTKKSAPAAGNGEGAEETETIHEKSSGPSSEGSTSSDNGLSHVLPARSEEHTSELQSRFDLVCRLLLEKKKKEHIPVSR